MLRYKQINSVQELITYPYHRFLILNIVGFEKIDRFDRYELIRLSTYYKYGFELSEGDNSHDVIGHRSLHEIGSPICKEEETPRLNWWGQRRNVRALGFHLVPKYREQLSSCVIQEFQIMENIRNKFGIENLQSAARCWRLLHF